MTRAVAHYVLLLVVAVVADLARCASEVVAVAQVFKMLTCSECGEENTKEGAIEESRRYARSW